MLKIYSHTQLIAGNCMQCKEIVLKITDHATTVVIVCEMFVESQFQHVRMLIQCQNVPINSMSTFRYQNEKTEAQFSS